ncbi:hypothetical protein [Nocardia wallacei]|uniref:hypothetical protein n=1 Tax=Nocardia wallacei TaxID=480035 RepID=UPI002455A0D4|nr:hypothetical protein [Nocardia wallacei]
MSNLIAAHDVSPLHGGGGSTPAAAADDLVAVREHSPLHEDVPADTTAAADDLVATRSSSPLHGVPAPAAPAAPAAAMYPVATHERSPLHDC